jgi:hypothetical protein
MTALRAIGLTLAAVVGSACAAQGGSGSAPTTTSVGAQQTAAVVQVSNDQFPTHAEPAVATNPTNPNNLLAATMVVQEAKRGLASYTSFDGGTT